MGASREPRIRHRERAVQSHERRDRKPRRTRPRPGPNSWQQDQSPDHGDVRHRGGRRRSRRRHRLRAGRQRARRGSRPGRGCRWRDDSVLDGIGVGITVRTVGSTAVRVDQGPRVRDRAARQCAAELRAGPDAPAAGVPGAAPGVRQADGTRYADADADADPDPAAAAAVRSAVECADADLTAVDRSVADIYEPGLPIDRLRRTFESPRATGIPAEHQSGRAAGSPHALGQPDRLTSGGHSPSCRSPRIMCLWIR